MLRTYELLTVGMLGIGVAVWPVVVLIMVMGGGTFGQFTIVGLPPVSAAVLVPISVDIFFFCALMWQFKTFFAQARTERRVVRCLETLLRRIGWLVLVWPLAGVVVWPFMSAAMPDGVGAILPEGLRGGEGAVLSFAFQASFATISLVFVGLMLLVVASIVERLRRAYDEMQLVI